jgi:hypothetical protein
LIVDMGAHFEEGRAAELRAGISQLDLFLQQNQELRHCLDLTLIAPRWAVADVQLEVIRWQLIHPVDSNSDTSTSSIIEGVLDGFAKRSADQSTTAAVLSHWLVLLTEGVNDTDIRWARRVEEQVRHRRLTMIPVIVGEGGGNALRSAMGTYRPPLRLQRGGGLRFFSWLGKELQRVVTTKPGKRVYLDVGGMAAWAQI